MILARCPLTVQSNRCTVARHYYSRHGFRAKAAMQDYQLTFIELALAREALRFGNFKLKSGRESPYFFNAGRFSDGAAAAVLGRCYAAAISRSGIGFDMLFGPAYKGIAMAAATAIALAGTIHAACRALSTARRRRITARAAPLSAAPLPAAF